MAEELLKSAYEVAREQRLQRNRKVMEELGLTQELADNNNESGTATGANEDKNVIPKRSKARVRQEATRRSKRVQGLTPQGEPIETAEKDEEDDEEEQENDFAIRMQIKIERLKALHAERKTTYQNPTATYEHTWMRVRTMSDKALERRITVIENALGKDCVVKMRMFAEVLLLAEKDDLATKAQEALDRLLALGWSSRRPSGIAVGALLFATSIKVIECSVNRFKKDCSTSLVRSCQQRSANA